jgi:hypothetical protein
MKTAEVMRFLAIEGLPGQEQAIGESVIAELKRVGVPASAIRFDKVNERITAPTQTGNLFVDLPGTRKGPRHHRRGGLGILGRDQTQATCRLEGLDWRAACRREGVATCPPRIASAPVGGAGLGSPDPWPLHPAPVHSGRGLARLRRPPGGS